MVRVDRPAPPVGSAAFLPRHALPPVEGGDPASAFTDLGPTMPPLSAMRRIANEAQQLVLILIDTTSPGPHGDPARAVKTLTRLRALVGADAQGD